MRTAYESEMSIWGAVMGCQSRLSRRRLDGGGLTASFEKLVLDVEMLQMMAETIKPMDVSASEIAQGLETIASVPTGGHFFGTEHTASRATDGFLSALLVSNWQNYENWELAGAGCDSARPRSGRPRLETYEPPPLDPPSARPSKPRRKAARGAAVGRSLKWEVGCRP
jgi:trimethylamine--corrinoid protein Co-methyltransferase